MTRDEIIESALQCGVWIPLASGPEREQTIDRLRRFAALVAAAERERLAQHCESPKRTEEGWWSLTAEEIRRGVPE